MAKQLLRAQETRHFDSGMHSQSARVAKRVARAGLTTGGSSDDTTDDNCAWNLFRAGHGPCSLSSSRLVDPCFAL